VKVLSLPEGLEWPFVDSRHLFVRNYFDPLWSEIKGVYYENQPPTSKFQTRRILVLGNSGIGKTAFLNYVLYQALQEGIPVLAETREDRYYFDGDMAAYEDVHLDVTLRKKRKDTRVLFLHDHQPFSEPPIIPGRGALTIAPVSPDPKHCHEFSKHMCRTRWVPLPTISEIAAMNSIGSQLPQSELQDRLELYGPIPRSIFDDEQEERRRRLESKISSFKLGQQFEEMLLKAELPEDKHGLSWWVVHVDAAENLKAPIAIDWASEPIRQKVWENQAKQRESDLEDYISKRLTFPTLLGPRDEYQAWAAFRIANGTKLHFLPVNTNKNKVLGCEEDFCLNAHSATPVSHLDLPLILNAPGRLYYSRKENEALCDAATFCGDTLFLFQMTTGETHRVSRPGFTVWVTKIKRQEENPNRIRKLHLIFVVPFQDTFALTPAQMDNVPPSSEDLEICVSKTELQPCSNLFNGY
jgi:hypothetical protein